MNLNRGEKKKDMLKKHITNYRDVYVQVNFSQERQRARRINISPTTLTSSIDKHRLLCVHVQYVGDCIVNLRNVIQI